MPDRKKTPDILGDLLGGTESAAASGAAIATFESHRRDDASTDQSIPVASAVSARTTAVGSAPAVATTEAVPERAPEAGQPAALVPARQPGAGPQQTRYIMLEGDWIGRTHIYAGPEDLHHLLDVVRSCPAWHNEKACIDILNSVYIPAPDTVDGIGPRLPSLMNLLSADGWELCPVAGGEKGESLFFKKAFA